MKPRLWLIVIVVPEKVVPLSTKLSPTLGSCTAGGAHSVITVIIGVPVIPVIINEVSRGSPVTGLSIGAGSGVAVPPEVIPLTISLPARVIRKLST